ncbi:Putative methyltransferase NSUN5 [Dufourea novaeangliae]|uniref:Putative methyltransferase NSUN5 n=1 Tax=Dufourea novaeangliae TaxID=178035 RepID=A0A154PQQ2_DUFNO|nr:Putative methyltransferase NSUN5 [Dufourea novaeangliae]
MPNGFEHSVKVPRLYKSASKIIRDVREKGGSLKSLIYEQRHPNVSAIYSLCLNALQKETQLVHLMNKTGILMKETRLDPWLAKILITELLWGKKTLNSVCKPAQTVLNYEKQLKEELNHCGVVEAHLPLTKAETPIMSLVTVLGTLFLYSIAMFTLPFAAFFGVQHIIKAEFHVDRFVTNCISVFAAVITVNLIIACYVYQALHEPDNIRKPRYVRVNTLLLPLNKALSYFKEEGWLLLPKCLNYTAHLTAVKNLTKPKFIQDFHVPELLVFPPNTTFHDHSGYQNGEIILQDKASCLPAQLLNPKPGSVVLDMCAAPGMKSSHIAALMKNHGKIYAVEIDKRRYTTLCEQIKLTSASCVNTLNEDALTLEGKDYSNVEYILVDPTCSGSGMLDRQLVHGAEQCTPQRLKQLQSFQVFLLRHALLNFPNVKRVVYSTCSTNPEENEQVVDELLGDVQGAYHLASIKHIFKDDWKNYSSKDYNCLDNCLYANPEVDLCNGFFVAVFERDLNVPLPEYKRKGSKANKEPSGSNDISNADKTGLSRKRKKRPNRKKMNATRETSVAESILDVSSESVMIIDEINNRDKDNEDDEKNKENGEEKNEDDEIMEDAPPAKKIKKKLKSKDKKQSKGEIQVKRKQIKVQKTKKNGFQSVAAKKKKKAARKVSTGSSLGSQDIEGIVRRGTVRGDEVVKGGGLAPMIAAENQSSCSRAGSRLGQYEEEVAGDGSVAGGAEGGGAVATTTSEPGEPELISPP